MTNPTSLDDIPALIAAARRHGACQDALDELDERGELADRAALLAHPDAPRWVYWYAKRVIGGRWPEAEPVIAKDPAWAYEYARHVIGGRWPEGEAAIAREPYWAYCYARDVIRGRWPKGEPVIASDPAWADAYSRHVTGTDQ